MYRTHPDAGIHSMVEWTLRRWKQDEKLATEDTMRKTARNEDRPRWFLNSEGQTLAIINGPVAFEMGSPPSEADRFDDEKMHSVSIKQSFAVGTKEVTVGQYQRFLKANPGINDKYMEKDEKHNACPQIAVT